MSIEISHHVWKHSSHKGSELLILLAIADNADTETKLAHPGIPYLAKKSRLSERAVQYAIRKLTDSGEVTVMSNEGPNGVNVYRVNTEKMDGEIFAPVQPTAPVKPTAPVQNHASGGAMGCTQTIIEPSVPVGVPSSSSATPRQKKETPTASSASSRKNATNSMNSPSLDQVAIWNAFWSGVGIDPPFFHMGAQRDAKALLERGATPEMVERFAEWRKEQTWMKGEVTLKSVIQFWDRFYAWSKAPPKPERGFTPRW